MTDAQQPNQPRNPLDEQARTPPQSASDLSRQIEQAVEREPGDVVRCMHLFGDAYRCNWWSRRGIARSGHDYDWAGLLTDQIRKSRFLRVTLDGESLVIDGSPHITTTLRSGIA